MLSLDWFGRGLWKYPVRTSKLISDVGWAKRSVPIDRWVMPPRCMGTLRFAHPTGDNRKVFHRVGLPGGLIFCEGERLLLSAVSEKAQQLALAPVALSKITQCIE